LNEIICCQMGNHILQVLRESNDFLMFHIRIIRIDAHLFSKSRREFIFSKKNILKVIISHHMRIIDN
jgi:hypothetical protein